MEAVSRLEHFRKWLRKSRPGQHYVYFTGSLAKAKGRFVIHDELGYAMDEPVWVENTEIVNLAKEAWHAHETGRVALFQRKLGDDNYEYSRPTPLSPRAFCGWIGRLCWRM